MSNYRKNDENMQGHPPSRGGLIDFACADIWSDHYHQSGYSAYQPPRKKLDQSIAREGLERRIQNLESHSIFTDQMIKNLQAEIDQSRHLQTIKPTANPYPTPKLTMGITEKDLSLVKSHG